MPPRPATPGVDGSFARTPAVRGIASSSLRAAVIGVLGFSVKHFLQRQGVARFSIFDPAGRRFGADESR